MFKVNRYSKYGFFFVLPSFVYFCLIFFYPLIMAFWNSFRDVNIMLHTSRWVGFDKFLKLFHHSGFQNSIIITFKYVIMVVPAILVLSLSLAIIILRFKKKLTVDTVSAIFFLPVITSLVSAGIIWQWIFNPALGVINNVLNFLGVPHSLRWLQDPLTALPTLVIIGIWVRLGFDMIIFITGILSIPLQYYEAAELDGASEFQKMTNITLPLLNPQIIMVSILELIFAFKVFDQIFVTTQGGPSGATKTIMVYLLKDVFNNDYGAACALTLIIILFLFFVSFIQWKFFSNKVEY